MFVCASVSVLCVYYMCTVLYMLYAGRNLVCHGMSVDWTFSDDEDEQPKQKHRLLQTPTPEPIEQE